jgi:HSP20 family protein
MQLIRSRRPELSVPTSRWDSWLRDPFFGERSWPSLFDWDTLFEGVVPSRRLGADLFEDTEAYHLRVELPGVKKEDLRVELENAVLTVTYERRSGNKEGEQAGEQYARSIQVPDGVAADKLSARLEDGILTVTMPKAEASKPRAITIE